MQAWAELPNALTPLTWQDLCQQWGGQPVQQGISMLHTWNWIPHPQNFVHENAAIPFLRASLAVPSPGVPGFRGWASGTGHPASGAR